MKDNQEYAEKAGNIRQLSALPPDRLIDHFASLHNTLDAAAPNLAPHVYSTAANAVQFLNSKLPSSGNELPGDKVIAPSQSQQNRWLELHKTVNDPITILDQIKNNTVNSHHVDALKSVYPDLHQEMSQKMIEQLGALKANGGTIPYQRKLAIGKFIGAPVDSTMTLQSMQAIMQSANSNQAPASQPQSPKKASGTALKQVDKVNSIYQTPIQAEEARDLKI